jgi:serine/threonine protein kinase
MTAVETKRDEGRHCPQCGSPLSAGALEGLCPACLLQQGAGAESTVTGVSSSFQPPSVAELAQWFPQLEVLSFIGKGGMGAVYKARQPGLDRLVALKILPAQAAADPGFAERFGREARALARLSHPNIVAVFESGQVNGLPYFLMEYMDGLNLRAVERSGKLTSREALKIVPQICEALQFAHDEGIVHRDIKPENILLDKKGRVKLVDFGIAKIMGANAPAAADGSGTESGVPAPAVAGITRGGKVIGTPNYIAPEQVEKPETVDHRADIYSLGVVFYEMLTGELPLGRFAPPSSRSRGTAVDARLDHVVLRALEKEPEHRYQQASQVRTAVETISGNTGPPGAATTTSPISQWPGVGHHSRATFFGVPLWFRPKKAEPNAGAAVEPGSQSRRVVWMVSVAALCMALWWAADKLSGRMTAGPISRWSGDGDAHDSHGRNNGTLVNVDFVAGKMKSAFQIKGPGSHVTIPDNPSLNPRDQMTLDAWICPTGPHEANAAIVSKTAAGGGYALEYEAATGGVRFGVYVDTPLILLPLGRRTLDNFLDHLQGVHHGHWVISPSGPPPPRNLWTHIAGVYDGKSVSFYMNGAFMGRKTTSGRVMVSTNDLEIGGNPSVPYRYFTGKIDEVSLYAGALSAQRIRTLYRAEMDASHDGVATPRFPPGPPIIPTTNNLWDVSQGSTVTRSSGIREPISDMRDMFGAKFSSVEPGNTVFADGRPAGFVHSIEWQTPAPVTMDSFALFASGDGPAQILPAQREFSRFVLKAKSSARAEDYDLTLYTLVITNHPYDFQDADTSGLLAARIKPVTAQFFRAEFTQYEAGRNYDGPRVIGLEGFGPSLPMPTHPLDFPAASNLVGWWRAGYGANDSSGHGNHGATIGVVEYTAGKTGKAFSFDGSSQYIDVGDSPSLDPVKAVTVTAWVCPSKLPQNLGAPIIKKAGNLTYNEFGYTMEYDTADNESVRFGVYTSAGWRLSPDTPPTPMNVWSFVAGVYDGTNLSIYYNGEPEGSAAVSGAIIPSPLDLQIGHDPNQADGPPNGPPRFFSGSIDDARVYNRALSLDEIRALYREGSGAG